MFFTWLATKQNSDDAGATTKEARVQQRLENAYIELLDMTERAGQWVQTVYPMINTMPPQSDPPLPTLAEQAHTEAVVRAFGSNDVRAHMETWRDLVRQVISTVEQVKWEEGQPTQRSQPSPRLTLGQLRGEERTAREALADQVAVELGHRHQMTSIDVTFQARA
jgi:hypothetical protein